MFILFFLFRCVLGTRRQQKRRKCSKKKNNKKNQKNDKKRKKNTWNQSMIFFFISIISWVFFFGKLLFFFLPDIKRKMDVYHYSDHPVINGKMVNILDSTGFNVAAYIIQIDHQKNYTITLTCQVSKYTKKGIKMPISINDFLDHEGLNGGKIRLNRESFNFQNAELFKIRHFFLYKFNYNQKKMNKVEFAEIKYKCQCLNLVEASYNDYDVYFVRKTQSKNSQVVHFWSRAEKLPFNKNIVNACSISDPEKHSYIIYKDKHQEVFPTEGNYVLYDSNSYFFPADCFLYRHTFKVTTEEATKQ